MPEHCLPPAGQCLKGGERRLAVVGRESQSWVFGRYLLDFLDGRFLGLLVPFIGRGRTDRPKVVGPEGRVRAVPPGDGRHDLREGLMGDVLGIGSITEKIPGITVPGIVMSPVESFHSPLVSGPTVPDQLLVGSLAFICHADHDPQDDTCLNTCPATWNFLRANRDPAQS